MLLLNSPFIKTIEDFYLIWLGECFLDKLKIFSLFKGRFYF